MCFNNVIYINWIIFNQSKEQSPTPLLSKLPVGIDLQRLKSIEIFDSLSQNCFTVNLQFELKETSYRAKSQISGDFTIQSKKKVMLL